MRFRRRMLCFELVPGRYHDFGIDSIPNTIPKVSIRYRLIAIRRSSSCMPLCFISCRPNSRMKPAALLESGSVSENKKKEVSLLLNRKQKTEKKGLLLKNAFLSAWIFCSPPPPPPPLIFPPFLGIDHLENVSIRYRYPTVLGIGIEESH